MLRRQGFTVFEEGSVRLAGQHLHHFVSHDELLGFARDRHGDLIHNPDVFGYLVVSNLILAEIPNFFINCSRSAFWWASLIASESVRLGGMARNNSASLLLSTTPSV